MLGKIESRSRGWQKMRGVDGIRDTMDLSLSKLRGIVRDGKPGMRQSTVSQRAGDDSDGATTGAGVEGQRMA